MILVDTSVWGGWFRGRAEADGLGPLVREAVVAWHPMIRGELILGVAGRLGERRLAILDEVLPALPGLSESPHSEVENWVRQEQLQGDGVGWVDVHLLQAAVRARVPLWTLDKALARVAQRLGVRHRL